MPRYTPREQRLMAAMRPHRPSYDALLRENTELRQDRDALLRELATARQAAGLPAVSYLAPP